MKLRVFLFIIGFIGFMMTHCSYHTNSDSELNRQAESQIDRINSETGAPNLINGQEKKLVKRLYEERDRADLICYAYLFNEYTGEVGQFLGKCIGYGIPASAQYSNPMKFTGVTCTTITNEVGRDIHGEYVLMPQAEPNGLFMPEGLSATWLMIIDPADNKDKPVYIEPLIIVSPFPLPHASPIGDYIYKQKRTLYDTIKVVQ